MPSVEGGTSTSIDKFRESRNIIHNNIGKSQYLIQSRQSQSAISVGGNSRGTKSGSTVKRGFENMSTILED